MVDAYFVVARESQTIIRLTHQNTAPADSPTLVYFLASTGHQAHYQTLLDVGRELIQVHMVMPV